MKRLLLFSTNLIPGLLEKHRQMHEKPFHQDKVDVKDMYLDLIKLIMDQEQEKWPKGHEQTKDIHKLQNYQELTNRSFKI